MLKGDRKDQGYIREAADFIRQGMPVAFPTETVYGLGGNGLDPASSARIYQAKGRPSDNPLILHIADPSELPPLVEEIPPEAEALMEAFWPGPLTLIFRKSSLVPSETSGGLETVAVRMPSHPAAAALIRAAGVPLAAPSANASGRPSPTCAEHVLQDLKGNIPLILDGGSCSIGLESTIVDVSGPVPEVLRPGYIGLEQLQKVLGTVVLDPAAVPGQEEDRPPRAPGMKYRHYAPKVPILLVEGEDRRRAEYIMEKAFEAYQRGEKTGALVSRETLPYYRSGKENPLILFPLGERERDESIARELFSVLRGLDAHGLSRVYSETFEEGPLGVAIMNRLRKAAAFREVVLSGKGEEKEHV